MLRYEENPTLTKRPILHRVLKISIAVALINFAAFMLMSLLLGGDAVSGHEENGHYFLSAHGKLTEVSRAIFLYSWWHTVTGMFGLALAMCGIAWMGPFRLWNWRP